MARKGSKSKGNAVEIAEFAAKYGSEALRYYLTAIAPEGADSSFTWEDFQQRFNGELADILGNYVHRVVTFAVNKLNATVPEAMFAAEGPHAAFAAETQTALSNVAALIDGFQFRNAMAAIMNCARAGNVYFDTNAPWKSIKTDAPECHRVIRNCLDRVAAIGLMLRPFLPKSAGAILANFGRPDPFATRQVSEAFITEYGQFPVDATKPFDPGSAFLRPVDIVKTGAPINKPAVLFKKPRSGGYAGDLIADYFINRERSYEKNENISNLRG